MKESIKSMPWFISGMEQIQCLSIDCVLHMTKGAESLVTGDKNFNEVPIHLIVGMLFPDMLARIMLASVREEDVLDYCSSLIKTSLRLHEMMKACIENGDGELIH
jgi:hypothetical protein